MSYSSTRMDGIVVCIPLRNVHCNVVGPIIEKPWGATREHPIVFIKLGYVGRNSYVTRTLALRISNVSSDMAVVQKCKYSDPKKPRLQGYTAEDIAVTGPILRNAWRYSCIFLIT